MLFVSIKDFGESIFLMDSYLRDSSSGKVATPISSPNNRSDSNRIPRASPSFTEGAKLSVAHKVRNTSKRTL